MIDSAVGSKFAIVAMDCPFPICIEIESYNMPFFVILVLGAQVGWHSHQWAPVSLIGARFYLRKI